MFRISKSLIPIFCIFLGNYLSCATNDLADLSMNIHSLTNRANELGILKKTSYVENPRLSKDLNQIIGSLETKKIITNTQNPTKASKAIEHLLQLFINDQTYKIDNGKVTFKYAGFTLESSLEEFSNELLLLANLSDYIATTYSKKTSVKLLSNTFTSPVLYLFLNSLFSQQKRPIDLLDLTIIGGISKMEFEKLKILAKKNHILISSNMKYYSDTKDFAIKPEIDIYLLNPNVLIDHNKLNTAICKKIRNDQERNIQIFPEDFSANFLNKKLFAAVDQNINKEEFNGFSKEFISKTKRGPKVFKDQALFEFTCEQKHSRSKMLANIINSTYNRLQQNIKLFLFYENKVVALTFGQPILDYNPPNKSTIQSLINVYAIIHKIILNLRSKPRVVNAALTNDKQLYIYDKNNQKFNKYKSINNINFSAENISDEG